MINETKGKFQPRRDDKRAGVRLNWEDTPPAGTVQHVKHGDVPSIEITLRQAQAPVEVFGGHDAEVSIIQRPDAWPHMDQGLYAYFTEYPGEGSFFLGPTDVDDELAIDGRAAGGAGEDLTRAHWPAGRLPAARADRRRAGDGSRDRRAALADSATRSRRSARTAAARRRVARYPWPPEL